MKNSEIENIILRRSYELYFRGDDQLDVRTIRNEFDCDDTSFWKLIERLGRNGLIRIGGMPFFGTISSQGILHVEKLGIIPEDVKNYRERMREELLDRLTEIHQLNDENDISFSILSQEMKVELSDLIRNAQVMEEVGYIEKSGTGEKSQP